MFGKLRNGMNSILKKLTIKELSEKDLEPIIKELTNLMIQNEVGVAAAEQIGKNLKMELTSLEHSRFKDATPVVKKALRSSIISVLDNDDVTEIDILSKIKEAKEENRPYIICMLGINGTGKTTTMAKLAKLFQKNKLSVVFAAGYTYLSGSIQQLGKHADNLGIRMIAHDYG